MILADKIIKERKKLGLSQEELAEKMNISRQSVSKWESNQSLPEIDKILLMSSIFGVTTDYLLKDEIETYEKLTNNGSRDERDNTENESNSAIVLEKGGKTLTIFPENTKENRGQFIRTVTMEQANDFLSSRGKAAKNIALGTFLCIMSVIPLFLVMVASENRLMDYSEDTAGALGLVLMFLILIPAVVLFVYTGSKNSPYEFLEKEPFETEQGVVEMVREKQKAFSSKYTKFNIAGIVFCLLSPIAIFIVPFIVNDAIIIFSSLTVTLTLAGIGTVFFILAGVRNEAMQKLLKEGDYSEAAKDVKSIKGAVGTIYWLVVTAVYLLMLFLSGDQGNDWKGGHSWIIWPVAGVLFPVVLMICDMIQNKRKKVNITTDNKQ